MFGLFGNKKFKFKCPICGRPYDVKFNPSKVTNYSATYRREKASELGSEKCGFCKAEMALLYLTASKAVVAYDPKWKVEEQKFEDAMAKLEQKIEALGEGADNINDDRYEKYEALVDKQESLQERFDMKEEKYQDRVERWHDKYDAKSR